MTYHKKDQLLQIRLTKPLKKLLYELKEAENHTISGIVRNSIREHTENVLGDDIDVK